MTNELPDTPVAGNECGRRASIRRRRKRLLFSPLLRQRTHSGLAAHATVFSQSASATSAWVLDEASKQAGFRATAWWQQARAEIVETVRRSLEELAALPAEFVPTYFDEFFTGSTTLMVTDENDPFCRRGVIDRGEPRHQLQDGRAIRLHPKSAERR